MSVHFSSKTPEWATPQTFFDDLNAEFHFTLDPCSTHENAKCEKHFTASDNGLVQDWSGDRVWMNPPYGREIIHWMKKAYEESLRGAVCVCLVPARTDTSWWHRYAVRGEVRFIKGRLKFGEGKNSAPFPSAVVVFRGTNNQQEESSMIEATLERIAAALERQAAAMENLKGATATLATDCARAVTTTVLPPVETPAVEKPAERSVTDDAERNALKVELHKRGIQFSERARTATLKELLNTATTPAPVGAPVEQKAPEVPLATPTLKVEEVRAALIQCKNEKGETVARDILVKFGKAEKLSAVAPENYAAIVKACGENIVSELAQ